MNKLLFTLALCGNALAFSTQAQQSPLAERPTVVHAATRFAAFPGMRSAGSRSTATSVRRPGTCVHYSWNNQSWTDAVTEAYTYDGQARLTRQADTDSVTQMPQTNMTRTFDANGNLLQELYQNWNGFAFANVARATMTYDSHNQLTEELLQGYDQGTWLTMKGTRFQYTYNAAGQVVAKVKQRLDFSNNTYINRERYLYTVPTSGEWTAETTQNWFNGTWRDSIRTTMVVWHDFAKDQMQSADIEERYSPNWIQYRFVGTYSPTTERRTLQLQQASGFVNHTSIANDYDAAGNLTSYREENWVASSGTWTTQIEHRYLYTYNATGDVVRRIRMFYEDGITNGLEYLHRDNYKNFQAIALATQPRLLPAETVQAYPNPSSDGRIRVETNLPGAVQLRLRDALGRTVLQRTYASGQGLSADLDLSQQPKGIYQLELSAPAGVVRQKVAVQ